MGIPQRGFQRMHVLAQREGSQGVDAWIGFDFVVTGDRRGLEWFRQRFQQRFEINFSILGLQKGGEREGKILNRIVCVEEDGWPC